MTATLTSDEAKSLIKKLLRSDKADLLNTHFQDITAYAQAEENKKTLIMSDIHLVLNQYFDAHRRSSSILSILQIAISLASEDIYSYPLAVNGRFLANIVKYLDGIIDKSIPDDTYLSLTPQQKVFYSP